MIDKLMLAPMAGVTDLPFRTICKQYGADVSFSEMISAKAIHYGDKKTKELLKTNEYDVPLVVQIFGHEPEIMAEAAKYMENEGVTELNINMGCPAPKIVNNGDGSALMKNPFLAAKIMEAVVNATSLPVSIKIRSGWDENSINAAEISKLAYNCGIKYIIVHPRTKLQAYSGKADRSVIRDVKKAVNIPVVANGDVFSYDDALSLSDETGCSSVMIGRGALGNPFIFKEIKDRLSGISNTDISDDEKKQTILKHLSLLLEIKGNRLGMLEFRKHIAWYLKGKKNSSYLKIKAFNATLYEEFEEIINNMFMS